MQIEMRGIDKSFGRVDRRPGEKYNKNMKRVSERKEQSYHI